jgi:formate dehydrogenase subunit gamma
MGLVFAVAVAWMFVLWRGAMRITDGDRAWRRAIGAYVRNENQGVPKAGRFNYGQKMLFWLMAGGAAALLLSGIVMWYVAEVPWDLHLLRSGATVIHAVAALVTIGAFIVHVYMGVAVVPGGLRAVVHGGVSEEWARHHHPLWLDERGAAAPAASDQSRQPSRGSHT